VRFFLLLALPLALFADTGVDSDLKKIKAQERKRGDKYIPKGPWLTGPLLTTSAHTVPKGHFNFEPYVYFIEDLGYFGSRGHFHRAESTHDAINSVEICQLGLTDRVDINIYPQFTYSYGTGKSYIGMGDIIIGPSFQIIRDDERWYGTTFKVGLNQVFPSASYDNLDPSFSGNDGIGNGGYSTKVYAVGSKLFHIYKENFFATRVAYSMIFFQPFKVHGINYFGGAEDTRGTLFRGASFILDIGLELTLNLNWALALDIENLYMTGSTFKGTSSQVVGNSKPSYMLSFAPAIEYNFSKNVGFIFGAWVSAYGSNANGIYNLVMALNWYI